MRTHHVLLPAMMLLAIGCKKEETPPVDPGLAYFPIEVGTWVEYQVDSLWRDDGFNVLDSVSYRLRERIQEAYVDPAGRPALRILRHVQDSLGEWQVRDVWSATRDEFHAERTEENVRRLKLSFPVREARRWDVNVYNPGAELSVAFREVDRPAVWNGLAFDSTVIVRNTVPPNAVQTRNYEEQYARNVGLVRKYWEESVTNILFPPPTPTDPDPPPVFRVQGFRLSMTVVDYGRD